MSLTPPERAEDHGIQSQLGEHGSSIWQDAPVLKGTTQFESLPDIKNIMITGGAGFIGSWLSRHLTLTYPMYNIIAFDKLDYCATLNNVMMLDHLPNFTFFHGDITSASDVTECLSTHHVDTIFHFAAQSHVDLSFGNSYQFTSTNVYGTHVLLESAKHQPVKRFIHISTDEVYGEVPPGADDLIEQSILAPTNPYSASKAAAEMLVNAYYKSFHLPVRIARMNNVYGPHQYPEKIIPKFTLLLASRLPLLLHGDGLHTRRYLHAADAADGLDTILHLGQTGQTYNIGTTDEISNLELCHRLLSLFSVPHTDPLDVEKWIKHTADRPFNDRRYAINGAKLRALGWSPKVPLERGLRETVVWYRQFGRRWWGDVDKVVQSAFPVVLVEETGTREVLDHEEMERRLSTNETNLLDSQEAVGRLDGSRMRRRSDVSEFNTVREERERRMSASRIARERRQSIQSVQTPEAGPSG